ncbi:MAG: TonB-dependent receptor, partial [Acidobacteriota bacterium]
RFNRTQSPFDGSDLGIFGTRTRDDRSLAGLDWTHMFSPTLLVEFRGGFSRSSQFERGEHQGRDIATELGLPRLVREPEFQDFPRITVRDHFELGTSASQPVQFHVTDIQYNNKFTWVKSKHVFKGGFDVSRVRYNQPYFNNQRGTYNFLGRWTNQPIGDLLLGLLNNTSRQMGFNRNYYRSISYGMFFNDDWKVSRNLTLNLGLRYELNKPAVDRYDKLANFVPGRNQLVVASAAGVPNLEELIAIAVLEGRVTTRQEAGLPRSLVYADLTNFAPRFGFAWRPLRSERTVLRGGYGIFYGGEILNPIRSALSNNFPFAINQTYNRQTNDPKLLTLTSPFPETRARL